MFSQQHAEEPMLHLVRDLERLVLAWQFDPATTLRAMSVFDLAAGLNR